MAASLSHPTIGTIIGKQFDGYSQYRGVKFANLKDAFATAELPLYDGSGIDATEYGPQPIGFHDGVDMEFGFIQRDLPKPPHPGVSDVESLTLNITVPKNNNQGAWSDLPVLVFIHGGGFIIGANWWPQSDLGRLVDLSVKLGKPFIGVHMNYRLGLPGFMTCPELRAAGYKPNNALRDQKTAIQWVKKYISGFGGNPDNLTVIGQSAGAISAGYLLLSEEPLAKRLVLFGGMPPVLGQAPLEVADGISNMSKAALGLDSVPESDFIQKLLKVPHEDFWKKTAGIPMVPVLDGEILRKPFGLDAFTNIRDVYPGVDWVDGIVVGYSEDDSNIMAYLALFERKKDIAKSFRASISTTLKDYPKALESILEYYSLSEAATSKLSDDEAITNILKLIRDSVYYLPAVELSATFPKDAYLLKFNEKNPWDGLFKGCATHILDVAFLFQNYNDCLDETQKAGAVALGSDMIAFINGEAPWKAYNRGDHGVAVYADGKRTYHEPATEENTGQSPFLLQVAKEEGGPGVQRVNEVLSDFLRGPPPRETKL